MGYTHYYNRVKELDVNRFKIASDDCKKVCDELPIPLGNWEGKDKPTFADDKVCFNGHVNSEGLGKADNMGIPWPAPEAKGLAVVGSGDDAKSGDWYAGRLLNSRCCNAEGDGSYETFSILRIYAPMEWENGDKKYYFQFCKTAYRPYDLNVQCCLIIFKQHFGDNFIVRSDGDDEAWNEAREVCQKVLGYGEDFKLDKNN